MPRINLQKAKPREKNKGKRDYQKVYQKRRWTRLRLEKLRETPLCERCNDMGLVTIADQVHHRVKFDVSSPVETGAYDYDNLESLCGDCHVDEHKIKVKCQST